MGMRFNTIAVGFPVHFLFHKRKAELLVLACKVQPLDISLSEHQLLSNVLASDVFKLSVFQL